MRQVQTNLLLYKETPISSLEEAQEDVQGADYPSRNRGRPPKSPQGHGPPEYVHTEKWGWGWSNECGGGVPVARSSILMTLNQIYFITILKVKTFDPHPHVHPPAHDATHHQR